jgi:hypothetical protein
MADECQQRNLESVFDATACAMKTPPRRARKLHHPFRGEQLCHMTGGGRGWLVSRIEFLDIPSLGILL